MVYQYNKILAVFVLDADQLLPNKHPDTPVDYTYRGGGTSINFFDTHRPGARPEKIQYFTGNFSNIGEHVSSPPCIGLREISMNPVCP